MPAVEAELQVGRQGALEMEMTVRGGVLEAEDAGVEGLTRTGGEAVLHKMAIGGEGGAFEDGVAPVGGIVEEGMADVAHVGADLVRAAGLEDTFDQRGVAIALEDVPVGDSMLAALLVVGDAILMGIYAHDAAVLGGAAEVADDGAAVVVEVAPDEGVVAALDGVLEELLGEEGLSLLVLGDEEEPGGVFVDAVDEIGGGLLST